MLKEEHQILLWACNNNFTLIQPTLTASLWNACFQLLLLTKSEYLASQGMTSPSHLLHHFVPFWLHSVKTTPQQTNSCKDKACSIINQITHNPNTFLIHQNGTKQLLFKALSSAFLTRFKLQLNIEETLDGLRTALRFETGVTIYLNSCPEISENYSAIVASDVGHIFPQV